MRAREEEESGEPEITLSTASLLGLFVGLVLVCGVFFGFGYSVGRRATANFAASTAGAVINNNGAEDADGSDSLPPASSKASSPDHDSVASLVPKPAAGNGDPVTLPVEPPAQAAPPASQTAKKSSFQPEASPAMVQVAAVVHQEDADVLVAALRRLGYTAVVRSGGPQDKFLHIQVGPFATRVEASAVKQKLAADGYNAIIKQ